MANISGKVVGGGGVVLVEKLFCSFFNPVTSLYINNDQYEKYGEKINNKISRGWPYSILGHSPRYITSKPLLQMQ